MERFLLRNGPAALCRALAFTAWLAAILTPVEAADFEVRSPGFYYTFNGGVDQNPALKLMRGKTYTFHILTASNHPFFISPEEGVQNNDINSGTLTYQVPTNATTAEYFCSVHGFGNQINFVDPAAPVRIVGLSVNTNLVVTSTGGAQTWGIFPEFTTNLATTNWSALTVQSNRFFNGTNEAICGRPPNNPVFIRIRAQPN